jgi:predicted nucleic acid-binding protein
MPFIVIYDANVLYPNTLRDLHIRIARSGLVQAKWTDEIIEEMLNARKRNHPDTPPEKLARLRELINNAVADCLVTGYEPLIDQLKLSDMDDRHVLAAAIKASAQVIVTADRGFTPQELEPWNVEAKPPDDFILDQISIDAKIVYACVSEIANSRSRPPQTVEDVLVELERAGLIQSVAALRTG